MDAMPTNWVWARQSDPEAVRERPVLCRLRKELTLPAVPLRAVCRVTADSRYILYVNGRAVCRGPQKGDDKVWFYDQLDLAPYLTEGINVLAAMVLHYPQTVEGGNRSVWRMQHPAFAAAGQIEWEDGSLDWQTDESWQAAPAKDIRMHGSCPDTSRLVIQEEARGDASLQGWQLPGYDAAGWQSAAVYPKGAFLPTVSPAFQRKRNIPFLFEEKRPLHVFRAVQGDAAGWAALLEKNTPLTLPAHSEAVVELAAGRLMTAYLTLRVQGGRGSVIQWMPAEGYVQPHDGGAIKGDRLDWQHGVLTGPTDRYEVGGFGAADAPECYEPFWFRALRFLQVRVRVGAEPLIIASLGCRETGYPLEVRTRVETSDRSLGDIWQISENTLRACMHETYEDCPFYEQLQYLMDTRSEILYTYASAADDRLARQAIDSFARSQRADGLLQDGPGLEQYSQHVQVFGVLTGTLTGQEARAALEQTLDDPDIPQCTVAMGFYLFRALEQCGLYHRTFRLWDKWRRMLDNHLTTCVESDGSYTRSDCHGWGALALYELPSAILGVRPAKPGYAAAAFEPAAGAWTHAAGEVVTPRGIIRAQWDVADGKLTKNIQLPEGMALAEETDDF